MSEFTIDQPDTGVRPDSGHMHCTVGFTVNKSSYGCLSTPRTGIFRPQNYLAYACCMKQGCSEMIQSVSPQRAQCQKYIPSPSLITDYLLSY